EVVELGADARESPGYDLLGAFIGSEGTLGIATRITVRLMRAPESVRTLLAGFPTTDEAGAAVSAIIADGITPAAIEMMDALSIEAAEQAVACGYPEGAGAVLVVEVDGCGHDVAQELAEVTAHLQDNGAYEIRVASDDTERDLIWKGRKRSE